MNEQDRAASTSFDWTDDDVDQLLRACEVDDSVLLALSYIAKKDAAILEAGCGTGRLVKYLSNLGYKNVIGLEVNPQTVQQANRNFPDLEILCGSILEMPFEPDSFDIVISLGVVEHFPTGLDEPINALLAVLKPGGVAIITVPSFNRLRRIADHLHNFMEPIDPRNWNWLRRALNRRPRSPVNQHSEYFIHPKRGAFFEYRLTRMQFESVCARTGAEMLISAPICFMDGLYHSFGPSLVRYENRLFVPSVLGKLIDKILRIIPFTHNHMHACVLRKRQRLLDTPVA